MGNDGAMKHVKRLVFGALIAVPAIMTIIVMVKNFPLVFFGIVVLIVIYFLGFLFEDI